MATAKSSRRFYQNGRLSTELGGSVTRSIFRHQGSLLAQCTSGAEDSRSIMAVNNTNTVMSELGHVGQAQFAYTPYGRRTGKSVSNNPLAFNGEPLDTATGCYLPGNGYRLFSPTLRRFCSVDSLSPFEQGGLNAYAYCAGDPVNNTDPTGHFPHRTIWIALSAISLATSVVAGIAGIVTKSETAQIISAIATAGIFLGAGMTAATSYRRQYFEPSPPTSRRASAASAASAAFADSPPPSYNTVMANTPLPRTEAIGMTSINRSGRRSVTSLSEPPPTYAEVVANVRGIRAHSGLGNRH
ncbi:RHS repeat-associated core domain-containing protein [Pseudomonas sp. LLC-1]|uniref:RHS repeat-associated core domain-containing protein n=1 Tax=Pseudomonas sp. LLC-1 TaxID=1812180 RepID=UPI00211401F0|nr:RHS repeat-associated core domain-containing protein [Pseudomonas sp. LLC-1]